jgi:hypothetical protein
MAEAMQLPDAQFQSWWSALEAELREGHPLAAQLVPAIGSVHARLQQTRIEREMLTAGLAILHSGQAEVARFRDPVTGAQFRYVPQAGGFELQSSYQAKGKPVAMRFAAPQ